jgi:Ala-tRNA(Pro) deacylase
MPYIEKSIKRILSERHIEFEESQHEAVYTSEQAASVRGSSSKEGIKSLIFRTDTGRFILVLNPGNKEVDTKTIARLENVKQVYLAKPEEVLKIAGVPIGCVAPFGLKTRLSTYLNKELLKNDYLYFNPGIHTKTIVMRTTDLLNILENPIQFTED